MGIPPHGYIREMGRMGIPPHGYIREMGKMGDNLRDSDSTSK